MGVNTAAVLRKCLRQQWPSSSLQNLVPSPNWSEVAALTLMLSANGLIGDTHVFVGVCCWWERPVRRGPSPVAHPSCQLTQTVQRRTASRDAARQLQYSERTLLRAKPSPGPEDRLECVHPGGERRRWVHLPVLKIDSNALTLEVNGEGKYISQYWSRFTLMENCWGKTYILPLYFRSEATS